MLHFSSYFCGPTWERINDPIPVGWRVPTIDELRRLLDTDKVNYEWTTINGVAGGKFTDRVSGNSLFLPAAGRRFYNGGVIGSVGHYGEYWNCRLIVGGNSAYNLTVNGGNAYWSGTNCNFGLSVRSVAD